MESSRWNRCCFSTVLYGSSFIRLIITFSFTLYLSSCQQSNVANADQKQTDLLNSDQLQEILDQKRLIALVDNSPSSYFIYKGQPMGYEYELLEKFCLYLGVNLEIKVIHNMGSLIDSLMAEKGHLVAANLTVTQDRKQWVLFSDPMLKTKQILVQRKPDHWRKLNREQLEKKLIRDLSYLNDKKVTVLQGTSFEDRLKNLNNEIGGGILIDRLSGNLSFDSLFQMLESGKIDYTIVDENLSSFVLADYVNLDGKTPVSFTQNIAWATNLYNKKLNDTINYWLNNILPRREKAHIYNKYFKWVKKANKKAKSSYSLTAGGQFSPYDDEIKLQASNIGWDWKLLASLIYQESNFDPNAKSWTGATGLMQVVPKTASEYTEIDTLLANPQSNLAIGAKHLAKQQKYWLKNGLDSLESIPFSLASYNVGIGHILDAQRLAAKYNKSAKNWGEVSLYLAKLSEPSVYQDQVVRHGYCRGKEPVQYVNQILSRYQHYNNFNQKRSN